MSEDLDRIVIEHLSDEAKTWLVDTAAQMSAKMQEQVEQATVSPQELARIIIEHYAANEIGVAK